MSAVHLTKYTEALAWKLLIKSIMNAGTYWYYIKRCLGFSNMLNGWTKSLTAFVNIFNYHILKIMVAAKQSWRRDKNNLSPIRYIKNFLYSIFIRLFSYLNEGIKIP